MAEFPCNSCSTRCQSFISCSKWNDWAHQENTRQADAYEDWMEEQGLDPDTCEPILEVNP